MQDFKKIKNPYELPDSVLLIPDEIWTGNRKTIPMGERPKM